MSDSPTKTSTSSEKDAAKKRRATQPTSQEVSASTANLALPDALQRAAADPGSARPSEVLALQRKYGNRAVQRLLTSGVQAKLTVGPAADRYEQEADRTADQVMAMPAAQAAPVQRQAEEEEEVQTKPLAAAITPLAQRAPEEEEEVQTKSQDPREGFEAGSGIESQLSAQKGGGSPLPADVRAYMEPRFGADFSGVRVHTGQEASALNRDLSAQAFTHGQDIYVGEGKYQPASTDGRRLLAHELTHVVQQTGPQASRQSVSRVNLKIQRALDLENTNWAETEEVIYIKGRHDKPKKGGANTWVTNPVLRFKGGGVSLWVKLGESAPQGVAASALVQAAGAVSEGKRGARGNWKISAPTIRAATPGDRAAMSKLVKGSLFSSIVHPIPGDAPIERWERQEVAQRLMNEPEIQIASHAGGEAGGSAESPDIHPDSQAAWGNAGFRKTLGYSSMLDLILGNFDRTYMLLAPQNWKVQAGDTLHLIDNVTPNAFQTPFAAWQNDASVQAARARNWGGVTNRMRGTWEGAHPLWDNLAANEKDAFLAAMQQGMAMAIVDLAEIRDRLVAGGVTPDKQTLIQRLEHILGWQRAVRH